MEELLFARNEGIDSACRHCETGKALDKGSEHPNGSGGIVKQQKNWEVFCNLLAMFTSIQGFVSKEPRG